MSEILHAENNNIALLEMNGESELIIGRGRAGKSGFAVLKVEKSKRQKKLIIVPQITINLLHKYDSIGWPLFNAEQLRQAWNDCETDALVVIYNGVTPKDVREGRQSIWKILTDNYFRDFLIFGDELAVLTSEAEDEKEFKVFIRHVGQNNQHFLGTSHRIVDDMPPVTALNVQKIWFIGRLNNGKEIEKLYNAGNVDSEMTIEQFTDKLKSQPKKYDWWSDHPNENAAFLIFY